MKSALVTVIKYSNLCVWYLNIHFTNNNLIRRTITIHDQDLLYNSAELSVL